MSMPFHSSMLSFSMSKMSFGVRLFLKFIMALAVYILCLPMTLIPMNICILNKTTSDRIFVFKCGILEISDTLLENKER